VPEFGIIFVEVFTMSFDDGSKGSSGNEPEDDDFYELKHGKKDNDDYMNDFLKDEDFELEGYEEKKEQEEESIEAGGLRSKRIKQRRKRRNNIFKIVAILFVIILVAVAVVFWLVPWIKGRFFTETEIPEEERIAVPESLILGDDVNIVFSCADENLLEPDISSIIFSSYYTSGSKLISLCIPPRTLMDIPGSGTEVVGKSVNIGGMDLLDLSLENNLGMDIEIDYHLLFDVYNTVNKLGGIEIQLEEELSVKNYEDGSTFKLEKGSNLIDGAEALNFLKYFSGIEKDVGTENIVKQKLILDAIIKKIAGENEEELAGNVNLIEEFIDTNSSMEDRLKIFSALSSLKPENNYVYGLDVNSSELEGEDIIYIPQNISKLAEIFSKQEIPPEEEAGDFTETVRITILNGAYDSPDAFGLAGNTSESFKNLKFDDGTNKYEIIEVGNSQDIYDSTQILVYSPDTNKLAAADDIIKVLGTGSKNIREDEISGSDIIIILGKDYLALLSEPGQVEEEDRLAKIIVLNGEGTTKLAATVTGILNDYFNSGEERVVMMEPKDADNHNYTQTKIVIFSSGDVIGELAQSIQERLGVGVIEYSENNVDNVDISVIVGSDYTNK
jgi:anionic cell wall polymer biosynthesis LytR-Cps2A-Psr (LCP) family protein